MNEWDYYLLKKLGVLLFLWSPLIICSIGIIREIKPFKRLKRKIFGDRYFVKVNGVWSTCRGKVSKDGLLLIKYGRDKHEWKLTNNNYNIIPSYLNKHDIEQHVIWQNIHDLITIYRNKKENRREYILPDLD